MISANLNEIDVHGVRKDTSLKIISGNTPRLLSDVWDHCQNSPREPFYESFLKSIITSCFFEALSAWKTEADIPPHAAVVQSVEAYINKNLAGNLSLNRVAEIAGYSPFFFHRIFSKYTGKALHSYVIEARLGHAKELLGNGQSVNSVAEAIGIESAAYFSRFFKRHTRINPSQWKDLHDNGVKVFSEKIKSGK